MQGHGYFLIHKNYSPLRNGKTVCSEWRNNNNVLRIYMIALRYFSLIPSSSPKLYSYGLDDAPQRFP